MTLIISELNPGVSGGHALFDKLAFLRKSVVHTWYYGLLGDTLHLPATSGWMDGPYFSYIPVLRKLL
jgi:hypothetical protein